jgi:hypothetical protein
MPMFLRQNPLPEWIDLWEKHPTLFWRKYWTEKKLGNLPPNFEYTGKAKGAAKEPTVKKERSKRKSRAKPTGDEDRDKDEESDGVDIKCDKEEK